MKRKVKGFTLVELLVVMAIFGIIMFGALQLIPPIMKMMVQADVHENGNAAVSSISKCLESELSTAEYLYATNVVPTTVDVGTDGIQLADTSLVRYFVEQFYEGVLRNGATTASPVYGGGKVHVLLVDNNDNGRISEIVYDVNSFEIGISNGDIVYESSQKYAVNKAYYDNYQYKIACGHYEGVDTTGVDFTDLTSTSYTDFMRNLSSKKTAFSILATTHRNNTDYSFVTNSTMSLVNINRNSATGGVPGVYYVLTELNTPSQPDDRRIVDITKGYNEEGYASHLSDRKTNPAASYSRMQPGLLSTNKIIDYVDGSTSGYCFIYSYGSEIDTQ